MKYTVLISLEENRLSMNIIKKTSEETPYGITNQIQQCAVSILY